jgi:hypothetical protein
MDFVTWIVLGSLGALFVGARRADREIETNAKRWEVKS